MQVGMIAVTPKRELADFMPIPILCGLAAGSAALRDEPFDQQGIAPQDGTSLSRIKKTADVGQRLSLIHAVQDSWKTFANGFANGLIFGLRLNSERLDCDRLEGAFQPP